MNQMYFKNILIADLNRSTAYFQEFSVGLNVVTSSDNHVGKSSLLKSLYHTMGAEVGYDNVWDVNTKLFVITFCVNDTDYRIARHAKTFAVFEKEELILLTCNTTKELSPLLETIFGFSVYLPNKKSKKIELSPPAFTFMPYYIDQDNGWSGLYDSFSRIDQYKKNDRIKSLYFHLNIYTKHTVEIMAEKDAIEQKMISLELEKERMMTILDALNEETQNIVPAASIKELERNLQIPKIHIKKLVGEIGEQRNLIQSLETSLEQHQFQLNVIDEYRNIQKDIESHNEGVHICPKCGYTFDEELYDIVRTNYNRLNEDYMCQQIGFIISAISEKLAIAKEYYITLMKRLNKEEEAFKKEQNEFDIYVRHRGLQDSINRYNLQLGENEHQYDELKKTLKDLKNQLKDLPNKKEIEEKYIELVRLNIIKLGAWNPAYDGNIKLLKPIKAQGALENKIILSQFVGLFQTIEYFKSNIIRFPFIVDSPRSKEASNTSSKDILKMIAEMDMLPQIILATIDYEQFADDIKVDANIIKLKEERLLQKSYYKKYEEYIIEMSKLLNQS